MSNRTQTFPLRLPASLKAAAEKIASIQTAEAFFAERRGRGNRQTAIRFLTRKGGEKPRIGDELPLNRR